VSFSTAKNLMDKLNRLIQIIHNLKEEGEIANVVGDGEKSLGYNINTGYSSSLSFEKEKRYAKGGRGSRRWWLQYLKGNK
jgi:hypothetical protein